MFQKITLFLGLAAVMLFTNACSKEQRLVNALSGEWKVTKYEIAGVAQNTAQRGFVFDKCDIEENFECNGIEFAPTGTESFEYDFSLDLDELRINYENYNMVDENYKIYKIDKNNYSLIAVNRTNQTISLVIQRQ
jgi:hypothetical protein